MSQENLEIVVGAVEAAQENPDAFFAIFDPSVEWDVSGTGLPDAKTYHGPDGVREFFRRWIGPFDDFGYEVEEAIDAGDSVIVSIHQWGRGKGSGASVDNRFWQCGRCVAGRSFSTSTFLREIEPLKPPACRSETLTPTPEPAGYCAGDVAGERGDRPTRRRGVECR